MIIASQISNDLLEDATLLIDRVLNVQDDRHVTVQEGCSHPEMEIWPLFDSARVKSVDDYAAAAAGEQEAYRFDLSSFATHQVLKSCTNFVELPSEGDYLAFYMHYLATMQEVPLSSKTRQFMVNEKTKAVEKMLPVNVETRHPRRDWFHGSPAVGLGRAFSAPSVMAASGAGNTTHDLGRAVSFTG